MVLCIANQILMKVVNLFLGIFLCFFNFSTYSQSSLDVLEKELAFHADVMVNAAEADHRVLAMDRFNALFRDILAQGGSFNYPFDKLKWISKKAPDDLSFRIFTWECNVGESGVKNFGIIQKKDGSIYELKDGFDTAENISEEEFGHENWLGAIYYQIMEGKTNSGEKYYLLFGMNKWSKYENVKIIDVLFFSKEGLPYFGMPIFKDETKVSSEPKLFHRLAFKYAADAQMTVNYNPGMEMIMVDNLIRRMSRMPGHGETLVPDGSYVGYQLKNGYWYKIDKIATEVMETAPRPKPILDERQGKNLNGNQIKKSK